VVISAFGLLNISSEHYGLNDLSGFGCNALSENNGTQNKNIGDNGGGPATCSDYSADRLMEELSGILSFN
jgi:hypothetical protein